MRFLTDEESDTLMELHGNDLSSSLPYKTHFDTDPEEIDYWWGCVRFVVLEDADE